MSETKKFEIPLPLAIIIAGVIVAASIVLVKLMPASPAAVAQGIVPSATATVRPPSTNDHIVGSPNAEIVLIEYSDFQCPFCSVIYPTFKNVVDASGGTVAWVMRHLPLDSIHPEANPSALASECVAEQLGSEGFFKYADTVFANQQQLSAAYSAQVAQGLGVDMEKYNSCVSSAKYQSVVDADSQEAQIAGGNGTPFTIVLNTKTNKAAPVSGAVSGAQIINIINALK